MIYNRWHSTSHHITIRYKVAHYTSLYSRSTIDLNEATFYEVTEVSKIKRRFLFTYYRYKVRTNIFTFLYFGGLNS